jgi:hypothetical protein
MSQDPKTPKKEINLNMPLDEFKKLTPEERRDYKIKADEMDRKTKEGYDKAKKQDFNKMVMNKHGKTWGQHYAHDGTWKMRRCISMVIET